GAPAEPQERLLQVRIPGQLTPVLLTGNVHRNARPYGSAEPVAGQFRAYGQVLHRHRPLDVRHPGIDDAHRTVAHETVNFHAAFRGGDPAGERAAVHTVPPVIDEPDVRLPDVGRQFTVLHVPHAAEREAAAGRVGTAGEPQCFPGRFRCHFRQPEGREDQVVLGDAYVDVAEAQVVQVKGQAAAGPE